MGTIKLYARIASKLAPTDPALAHVGASLLAINPLEVNKKSEYSLKLNIFFAQ
ncbi:hypothetical protein [Stutzerimonas nitrititolerans]|uniref:hypothetical protein n=1 Tax=Stutzerimonas nitrititolerans TaxID=2482751 RepID=UPI0028A6C9FE|nr:hypothetical protein [Stutzerimonas nitrititolerans]